MSHQVSPNEILLSPRSLVRRSPRNSLHLQTGVDPTSSPTPSSSIPVSRHVRPISQLYMDNRRGAIYWNGLELDIGQDHIDESWRGRQENIFSQLSKAHHGVDSQQTFDSQKVKRRKTNATSMLSRPTLNSVASRWIVHVGDIVAVEATTSQHQPSTARDSNRWYPFHKMWKVGQILEIVQKDRVKTPSSRNHDKNQSQSLSLTVRWFYRKSDFDDSNFKSLDKDDSIPMKELNECTPLLEEIVESNDIAENILPTQILGFVFLFPPSRTMSNCLIYSLYIHLLSHGCPQNSSDLRSTDTLPSSSSLLSLSSFLLHVPFICFFCHQFIATKNLTICTISNQTGKCIFDEEFGVTTNDPFHELIEKLKVRLQKVQMDTVINHADKETGLILFMNRLSRGFRVLKQIDRHHPFTRFLPVMCDFIHQNFANAFLKMQRLRDVKEQLSMIFLSSLSNRHASSVQVENSTSDGEELVCDDGISNYMTEKSKQLLMTPSELQVKERKNRIWSSLPPFHIDKSSLMAFYSEISISDSSLDYNDAGLGGNDSIWNVRMGDTVAVHVPGKSHSLNGSFSRINNLVISQHYPFGVPWWTGEVVSIHRILDASADSINFNEVLNLESPAANDKDFKFILEIRWFYTPNDIPGSGSTLSSALDADARHMQELLETDEVHDVAAETLLAPVTVLSDTKTELMTPNVTSVFDDMNGLRFFCHRSWSIHRKTLMPTGTSSNRHDRGMMYSKYLGKGMVAREKFEGVAHLSDNRQTKLSDDCTSTWKQMFLEATTRLTLTDASADAQLHGINLTGREKEQEQIFSFLRSAIGAANSNESSTVSHLHSFCLFICGPPGTGKTASARYVISHLRKEQAEGKLATFEFVSLNGMELRHPFEAYVRLWETVSSNKDKRSPGEAAARLEALLGSCHEGNNSSVDENILGVDQRRTTESRRRVIVCLLDEIDYLVTNKQTVVYNFFDWPVRGFISKSKAQIIVLGISNTLNLPERLHPRVSSRLGRDRCVFRAYNVEESINILKSRLGAFCIFQPDAITFAARKTAAESGDIRKAFRLCKTAAEIVYSEIDAGKRVAGATPVTIADIQKASREMFGTVVHKAVSHATAFEALLFVCLASLKRQSGREDGGFCVTDILTKMDGVSRAIGDDNYFPPPTFSELLGMLNRLGEARVLSVQTPNGRLHNYGVSGANSIVSLQIEDYEVLNCLKETKHGALAEKYLTKSLFFS